MVEASAEAIVGLKSSLLPLDIACYNSILIGIVHLLQAESPWYCCCLKMSATDRLLRAFEALKVYYEGAPEDDPKWVFAYYPMSSLINISHHKSIVS